jgi:hypothetical protein
MRTEEGSDISDAPQRRRGRWGWALPLAVLVVCLLAAGMWATSVISPRMEAIDDLPGTPVPGEMTITAEEAGELTLYYERRAWLMGIPDDLDLDVDVTGPGGSSIPVDDHDTERQFRSFGRVGQAVATFETRRLGDYQVTVDGRAPDDARVLVSGEVVEPVFGGLTGPMVLAGLTVLFSLILGIRAGWRD